MSKESFAIINDKNQVVNHILVDKDAPDFDAVMAEQLAHWGCIRYVETTEEQPVIILDESPTIWTTHSEEEGFVLPEGYSATIPVEITIVSEESVTHPTVTIKGRVYPADSLLIKENAASRPADWTLPVDETEVSLADAE